MGIESTLDERKSRYGDFSDHAYLAQRLTVIASNTSLPRGTKTNWDNLDHVKRHALTYILDKIARILTGDPEYRDNWHDIQGYAKLAEDRCKDPDADKQGVLELTDVAARLECCPHGVPRGLKVAWGECIEARLYGNGTIGDSDGSDGA